MTYEKLTQRYNEIIYTYIEKSDERSLYDVSKFARICIGQNLGPETLVEMHSSVLFRIIEDRDIEVQELVAKANQVLLEAIMTYGLIYQGVLERKKSEYKTLRTYSKKIEKQSEEMKKLYRELEISNAGTNALYKELDEKNKQLQVVNKELEAFSYSVSHDLRSPLLSIDGFSQALLEDYYDKLDEQGKDFLKRIKTAIQRMGQLIDDLLLLSRTVRYEMIKENVNLSNIVKKISDELRQRDQKRNVEFVIKEGIIANCDERLLTMVLQNFIENAWKFTSKHKSAKIEFGVKNVEGRIVYYIKDDGAGFDIKYVNKLFNPFQRLHSTTEFKGTGIGLASIQRIIHRHSGDVWAEGEVEKGATFYFTLGG